MISVVLRASGLGLSFDVSWLWFVLSMLQCVETTNGKSVVMDVVFEWGGVKGLESSVVFVFVVIEQDAHPPRIDALVRMHSHVSLGVSFFSLWLP